MDLSPLYELRARLRAAMIAGTNLLSEDFRLKRAAEAFAPLEQASPVFARIGQLTKELLSPEGKDKEGALLDTITLADAVLCTQGTVAVAEELEPIQGSSWGSAVTNAPYSVIKNLLDALLSSGSGHYSYVLDTHEQQPEVFKDYRVKAAMVQALGASYAELAETVAQWLKEEDVAILPLLQRGFDPKGKKEMVRRVRVMEAIDAEASNPFFLKALPEAEKEVRQSLIYALRYSPDNADLLLKMTRTEKGNAKKMAYYALACMEDERAKKAFGELAGKKPAEAMQYLIYVETKWASELAAETLKELLAPWTDGGAGCVMSQEQSELLDMALAALPGKSGGGICEVYRMAANIGGRLKHPFEDKKTVWVGRAIDQVVVAGYTMQFRSKVLDFQSAIPCLLHQSVLVHPDEMLCSLARELYESGKKDYFPMAVVARLISEEDSIDWLEKQREKLGGEFWPLMTRGLDGLMYSEREQKYVLRVSYAYYSHPSGEPMPKFAQPVKQEITGRFTDFLTECRHSANDKVLVRIDRILRDCADSRNEAYLHKLEEYFYSRALTEKNNRPYLEYLRFCGCNKCEGLAVHYYTANRENIFFTGIAGYASLLPGDGQAKYAEIQKVYDLYLNGKIAIRDGGWGVERFLEFMEELKNS